MEPRRGGVSGQGAVYNTGSSIYNAPPGKGIRSGSLGVGGQYNLAGSGYSRLTKTLAFTIADTPARFYGAFGSANAMTNGNQAWATGSDGKLLQWDPQITNAIENSSEGAGSATGSAAYSFVGIRASLLSSSDLTMIKDVALFADNGTTVPNGLAFIGNDTDGNQIQDGYRVLNVRRLNQLGTWDGTTFTSDPLVDTSKTTSTVLCVVSGLLNYGNDATGTGRHDSGLFGISIA